jgi:hypothetical protein
MKLERNLTSDPLSFSSKDVFTDDQSASLISNFASSVAGFIFFHIVRHLLCFKAESLSFNEVTISESTLLETYALVFSIIITPTIWLISISIRPMRYCSVLIAPLTPICDLTLLVELLGLDCHKSNSSMMASSYMILQHFVV